MALNKEYLKFFENNEVLINSEVMSFIEKQTNNAVISQYLNSLQKGQSNLTQQFDILEEKYNNQSVSTSEEMYLLGKSYLEGSNGFDKNNDKAYYWLELSVKQGYIPAKSLFKSIHIKLNGSPKELYNYGMSLIAYDNKNDNLGKIEFKFNQKDYEQAFEYIELSANKNDSLAQNKLGNLFYYGLGTKQDYEKAFEYYQKATEQGSEIAQCNLATCYLQGHGVKKDSAKAIKMYRKLAVDGHAEAQFALYMSYESKNPVEAVKWLYESAEQGYAPAQNHLGICNAKGKGIAQDLDNAVHWYRQSAEQGYAPAQNNLGMCYERGEGVDKDLNQAVMWYLQSAKQENSIGLYNLGYCYEYGEGVDQNLAKSVNFYRQSAEKEGDLEQNNLGVCYEYAEGAPKEFAIKCNELKASEDACLYSINGHSAILETVCFSPCGHFIASAGRDNSIKIWSIYGLLNICSLNGHNHTVWSIAYSPCGNFIASGSEDKTVKIWSIKDRQCVRTISELSNESVERFKVTYSPCGNFIALGGAEAVIKIISVIDGKVKNLLRGHRQLKSRSQGAPSSGISFLRYSPCGNYIASAGWDETIKIWHVQQSVCIKTLKGHTDAVLSLAYSPCGNYLVSGANYFDEDVKIWSIKDGKNIKNLQNHVGWIESVAYSPCGNFVASGSDDHTIKIWSVKTASCVETLVGHTDTVCSIDYSPCGNFIISVSNDYTIRLWLINKHYNPFITNPIAFNTFFDINQLRKIFNGKKYSTLKDVFNAKEKDRIARTFNNVEYSTVAEAQHAKELDSIAKRTFNGKVYSSIKEVEQAKEQARKEAEQAIIEAEIARKEAELIALEKIEKQLKRKKLFFRLIAGVVIFSGYIGIQNYRFNGHIKDAEQAFNQQSYEQAFASYRKAETLDLSKFNNLNLQNKLSNTYLNNGFNYFGFDRMGFDKNGYNQNGFDRLGYDKLGYNQNGFDKLGYDKNGYNQNGFDKLGFDRQGYNRAGFDKAGFDKNGYNKLGYDKNGYNQNGFDRLGYDKLGFDKLGFDRQGYNKDGFDKAGYDNKGYNKDGYNKLGQSRNEQTNVTTNSVNNPPYNVSTNQNPPVILNLQEKFNKIDDMLKASEGNNSNAVYELMNLIANSPKPPKGNRKVARKLNDEGNIQMAQRDFYRASQSFKQAVSADDSDVEINNNLADSLIRLNQLSEAEHFARKALSLQPNRTYAWMALADIYARQNEWTKATAALKNTYRFSNDQRKLLENLTLMANDPEQHESFKVVIRNLFTEINR